MSLKVSLFFAVLTIAGFTFCFSASSFQGSLVDGSAVAMIGLGAYDPPPSPPGDPNPPPPPPPDPFKQV